MKKILSLFALSLCVSTLSASAAPKAPSKPAKKVEIVTCPIAGGASKGSKITRAHKNYLVRFCCAGCDSAWDKLSVKEKDAKIAAIQKKKA